MKVSYHKADKLNQIRFSIEKIGSGNAGELPPENSKRERESLLSEVRCLASGSQFSDRPDNYLLSVLDAIIAKKTLSEVGSLFELYPSDAENYLKVVNAIQRDSTNGNGEFFIDESSTLFRESVNDHAAGCLSPLVKTLNLAWPAQILKEGISITDLPGVGVVGDKFPEATKNWIMKNGRSVVLVVDQSGLDQSSARTLSDSDFLKRLLFSYDDPTQDPIHLTIVVTQMDKHVVEHDSEELAAKEFFDKCENMKSVIRRQLATFFQEYLGSNLADDVKEAKQIVISQLEKSIEIVPLSAKEYLNSLTKSKKAIFNSVEDSKLPEFARLLLKQSAQYRDQRDTQKYRRSLQVETQVRLALSQREMSIQARLSGFSASENLKAEFSKLASEQRLALAARHGEFTTFMKKTVKAEIIGVMETVRGESKTSYRLYCKTLRSANWATLKAAIKRGGTFSGATRIDLQQKILDSVSEGVAVGFRKKIVANVRDEARKLTKYNLESIDIAISIVDRHKLPKIFRDKINLVKEELESNMEMLKIIGEERLKEFSQEIRVQLVESLREAIGTHCDAFINSPKSSGSGVKDRMLDLVTEAGEEAVDVSIEAAQKLISDEFSKLYARLVERDLKAYSRDLMKEIEGLFGESVVAIETHQFIALEKELKPILKKIGEMKMLVEGITIKGMI